MKKLIEITAEWVIAEMAESNFPSGDGCIMVYTLESSRAAWIKLALDTLNIRYSINDYDHGDGRVLWGFDFRIEDIKVECPDLYVRYKETDANYSAIHN